MAGGTLTGAVPSGIPSPSAEARALSARLVELLAGRIGAAGGFLPFDAFMEAALYEPGLGYYSNGLTPFGEEGDFVTAPESGDLFGRCLARSFAPVLTRLADASVLELGAGSGALALALLPELAALDALPARYAILERSPAMRALQQSRLKTLPAALQARVEWLDTLPQHWSGVVFGNEVADALPVKRFEYDGQSVRETGVGFDDEGLQWRSRPAREGDAGRVLALAREHGWEGGYRCELCPPLADWVAELGACLHAGMLMLIDYGYGRAEYYHPQRNMGTLLCHYRHHAHDNALWFPGLQDITAFVDFTTVAEAGAGAGLQLLGYTSQARFLVAAGIERVMAEADPSDLPRFLAMTSDAKRLMLPGEMGDRFKVIGFSRNLDATPPGFDSQDLRSRL